MYYSANDLNQLDKIVKINLINSITGIKPANLIGTRSSLGQSNLAIISSIVHLGSSPGLIGFIMRPSDTVERHTYDNILETKSYTINHVLTSHIEAAHYTSAKFDRSISEFSSCGFTEVYHDDFPAPYVQECKIKLGISLEEIIDIKLNGTKMLIGSLQHIYLEDQLLDDQGQLDLAQANGVGISGLNRYYALNKIGEFPYARVADWKNKMT